MTLWEYKSLYNVFSVSNRYQIVRQSFLIICKYKNAQFISYFSIFTLESQSLTMIEQHLILKTDSYRFIRHFRRMHLS